MSCLFLNIAGAFLVFGALLIEGAGALRLLTRDFIFAALLFLPGVFVFLFHDIFLKTAKK
jgi:hypothetical protein